jgi:O-methyltransferase
MHHATRRQLAKVLWPKYSKAVDTINHNADLMATIQGYEAEGAEKFADRKELYGAINKRLGDVAITYLEFGVWKGETLAAWTKINTSPDSRFHGFDSFEGLPEDWGHAFGTTKKGAFSADGILPEIPDKRVSFYKGWFQNTLRPFLAETKLFHPIVLHNDSDLHSSTLYTLSTLDPLLQAGDIIIFDEYEGAAHEFLAWQQYQRAFMRSAKCIAMSDQWTQAAFVML